jgi:hypothetical protein
MLLRGEYTPLHFSEKDRYLYSARPGLARANSHRAEYNSL